MQLNKVFSDWLSRRHITKEVQEEFGITGGTNEYLGECIVIPVKGENGDFLYNKYRRNPLDQQKPKYLYDKGGKIALYGAWKAKDEKQVLITEGEMDCLVAWSANIPAVTSTGGAMSFQAEWVPLFADKEAIICLDNDPAGGEGMVKILGMIPHAKVMFVPDRAGVKDISDYVEGGGSLNELLKTAKFLPSLEAVKENRADRVALWQSVHFHDAYIKEHEKPISTYKHRVEASDRLTRAKAYPIKELMEFRANKARCLWHNEKTPSLQYYEKTNTCYCFGQCGRVYDAIDVYRKLHNCSFNEAVNSLQ